MFNGKHELNNSSPTLIGAFGISEERHKSIMRKLNAVAAIYPEYIPVVEVWLNCDQFTDMEKAYGLFTLGKMFGMGVLMKKAKIKVRYPLDDSEGNLLTKLYNGRKIVDKILQDILKGN